MIPSSFPKKSMPMLRAVVLDLDDTLYAERDYVLSGMHAVVSWAEEVLGVPRDDGFIELQMLFESEVRGNIFDRWLDLRKLAREKWVPFMIRVYREHPPQISPYPGTRKLLGRLR